MFSQTFRSKFSPILDGMPLSYVQKGLIHARYVDIVTGLEWSQFWIDILYYLLTNAVTISAVLIVAFSSFDMVGGAASTTAQAFSWVVWSLGIVAALSNKWLYSYDIPKKYVLYAVIIEKLQSEGWSFAVGIDRYNISDIDARFQLFCSRVEQIQMKSAKSKSPGGNNEAETVNDVIAMGSSTVKTSDIPVTVPDDIQNNIHSDITDILCATDVTLTQIKVDK